jgi:hypothetical protein
MLEQALRDVLRNSGNATVGTNTTLTDTARSWIVNAFAGITVKILHAGIEYSTIIASNTANQLTFTALPGGVLVAAGDAYFFPLDLATVAIIVANLTTLVGKPSVSDVVIYPVAVAAGTTVISDDGSSPAYYPTAPASTTSNNPAAPGVAWSQLIDFEQGGIITIISIEFDSRWQSKLTLGAGNATLTNSKLQISRDGGANWVDITDVFSHVNVAMTTKSRQGVGRWITTIVAGVSQLGVRLVHWTNDSVGGAGRSSSEAQVRSDLSLRITYRKS